MRLSLCARRVLARTWPILSRPSPYRRSLTSTSPIPTTARGIFSPKCGSTLSPTGSTPPSLTWLLPSRATPRAPRSSLTSARTTSSPSTSPAPGSFATVTSRPSRARSSPTSATIRLPLNLSRTSGTAAAITPCAKAALATTWGRSRWTRLALPGLPTRPPWSPSGSRRAPWRSMRSSSTATSPWTATTTPLSPVSASPSPRASTASRMARRCPPPSSMWTRSRARLATVRTQASSPLR
mmetsp:Transcript_48834/g.156418  ORF Transcript_48834/g.156418 Transcript_48834/m.156418 type:complete len:239 (-) Transcript_48834:896-1612(-)